MNVGKQPSSEIQDRNTAEGWRYIAALPNLDPGTVVEIEPFAIVPATDTRMERLRIQSPAIDRLVKGFGERKRQPQCLSFLVREGVVAKDRLWDAAVDARNIIALNSVSLSAQDTVGGPNAWGTVFTDYFDFYPAMPSSNGEGLRILTPAKDGYSSAKSFEGYLPPHLPTRSIIARQRHDRELVANLMLCWKKKHVRRSRKWHFVALFRSLGFAYRAARMPTGSDNYLHDFGINLGLWNAALECLVHPEDGMANKNLIFDLLGRRRWGAKQLTKTSVVRLGRSEKRRLNFIQRCYNRIRIARNDFLHGNRISLSSIVDRRVLKVGTLNSIAPVVYQVAIEEFLNQNGFNIVPGSDDSFSTILRSLSFEKALKTFQTGRNDW